MDYSSEGKESDMTERLTLTWHIGKKFRGVKDLKEENPPFNYWKAPNTNIKIFEIVKLQLATMKSHEIIQLMVSILVMGKYFYFIYLRF